MTTVIKLQKRELTGKKNRSLLNSGFVPAVLFNKKGDSRNVMLTQGDVERLLKGATKTTIFDVEYDGTEYKALIKEVDYNPSKESVRHLSFFELDKTDTIDFEIPVQLTGIAPAVKNNLGVLIQSTASILARCKLGDLVPFIEIDISALVRPGQVITLGDITLPNGIELVHKDKSNLSLVSIGEVQKSLAEEDEAAKAAAALAGEVTESEEGVAAEGDATAEGEETKKE